MGCAKVTKVLLFFGILCIVSTVPTSVCSGRVSLELHASPDPVSRGDRLTYTITITNTSGVSLTNLTFHDPLPTGMDQWSAEYRANGGGWAAYPVSGLIALGTLASGATSTIEVRARVEFSAPGSLSNAVTVADNTGPLASSSLITNVLPSVDAGADKMVALSGEVILGDASAGDGGDGIAAYSWSDHGGGGSFDNPNLLHPTYSAPGTNGLLTLTLTVTDHQGGQASDSLRLRVNAFPTVDAGPDRSVNEGGSVTSSDAVASDSDGWIVSIQWDDRGAGGTFSPTKNTLNPTYTAPTTSHCGGEDLTLTLTVTDNWGASASDSLTLHVNNVNSPPTASAGADQTVSAGETVSLAGSASDSDGRVESYMWEQLGGPPVTLSDPGTAQPSFIAPPVSAPTTLRFRLTVTDDCGAQGTDEVVVIIEPEGAPLVAEISVTKRADRTTAKLGELITYTYTVLNSGELPLLGVNLIDDKLGALTLGQDRLAPGESATATASTTVTESEFPGPLVNTVTASARSESGILVSAVDTASVQLVEPSIGRSSIEVKKEAQDSRGLPLSPFSPLFVGDVISYLFTVTNTGETVLSDIVAVDDRLGPIPLGRRSFLAPWETTRGTVEKRIEESDLPGPLTNTVIVTAITPTGQTITARASLNLLELSGESRLNLTVEASTEEATVGGAVAITYTASNWGRLTVTELELHDELFGEITLPTTVLAPGESLDVTVIYTVTLKDLPGPLLSTGRLTGIDLLGRSVIAESGPLTISVNEATDEVAGAGGVHDEGRASRERVIINEIAWAGTPADPDDEWIELCNLGTAPVDLSGWSLCWYPKGGPVPDPGQWQRIELFGVIDASPVDLSPRRQGRPEIIFLKRKQDELSWLVFDMSWWGAGKQGSQGRGYYLLEREHDGVVSDVAADLIYDGQPPYRLELPDEGAVMLLLDANGEIVDRANSEHPHRTGWIAGDAGSCATMERTDPFTGDVDANWHTNPGVLVYGTDSAGNRLFATAGKPNSPDLAELTVLAERQISPYRAKEQVNLTLETERKPGRPRIQVTTTHVDVAGAGGALNFNLSVTSRYEQGKIKLGIDTSSSIPGIYYVWITSTEGKAILIPIAIPP